MALVAIESGGEDFEVGVFESAMLGVTYWGTL